MLLLKTAPGIEDILSQEAARILGCKIMERRPGRIICCGEDSWAVENLYPLLKTAHSIYRVLVQAPVSREKSGLAQMREYAGLVDWEKIIPWSSTYAVRGERIGGGHQYTSMEVAAAVGEEIYNSLSTKGHIFRVSLNSPSISIGAMVVEDNFILALRLYGEESLHRRWYRLYSHHAALKPSLAAAMLYLAGVRDGGVLLDPMCGGGTIAIEAALMNEHIKIICSDSSQKSIRMAMLNAAMARVRDRILFKIAPVSQLPITLGVKADAIVTNPPYGIRMGGPGKARKALEDLFHSSQKLLDENGLLVLITPHRGWAMEDAGKTGFRLLEERRVLHGNLYAWIMVFSREK